MEFPLQLLQASFGELELFEFYPTQDDKLPYFFQFSRIVPGAVVVALIDDHTGVRTPDFPMHEFAADGTRDVTCGVDCVRWLVQFPKQAQILDRERLGRDLQDDILFDYIHPHAVTGWTKIDFDVFAESHIQRGGTLRACYNGV
jgi:hypothetical protein